MEYRNTNSIFRYIDWFTVILYVILVTAGAISIYAASYDYDHASIFAFNEYSGKQIRWIVAAFAVGLFLLLIDSRFYEIYAGPIYLSMLLLLLLTIFIAPDIKGSRSWLVLGPMSLQPAEFAKVATALALAKIFSDHNFSLTLNPKQSFIQALLIIFVPILLILGQKETGSALAYLSLFFVLYREGMSGLVLLAAACAVLFFVVAVKYTEGMILGIPAGQAAVFIMIMMIMVCMLVVYCKQYETGRNIMAGFAGAGLIATILSFCGITILGYIFFFVCLISATVYTLLFSLRGWYHRKVTLTLVAVWASVAFLFSINYTFENILQHHQQERILVTLGIKEDLRGAGYNVNQSKIAIGSGGVLGKGFLNGTQTKLKYVPEQHTDFIFCTIGEEEGFVGSAAVLLLFLTLILRVITIAERQPSAFGRVYAYCVASYLIFHLVINIGMVIGLCPVIGIPLPFFSYGGSSLWGFTFLLFILLRIDASRNHHIV